MIAADLLDEHRTAPENIGATLQRAREAAGYSIADVAERMRLSRRHIENLEAERFDLFPVSVFLRGYLISYARLVRVDAAPLLEAYDRRGFGPPQLHSQDTARTTTRGSELTVTVTTLIVIAILIVLSALWWRDQWTENGGLPSVTVGRPGDAGGPNGTVEDPGEGPGEAGAPSVPTGEPDPEETTGRDAVANASADPFPPVPVSVEPPPVPAAEAEPPAGETAPRVAEPAEGVAEEGPEPEAAAAQTAEPDAAGEAERPAAGEGEALASLVIRVREDCWLMIRDADERLIFRDLAAAGTVLDLAAAPPIGIVAGYAHGLEIEYNGEPFDLSPYVEGDTGTARFRLGS